MKYVNIKIDVCAYLWLYVADFIECVIWSLWARYFGFQTRGKICCFVLAGIPPQNRSWWNLRVTYTALSAVVARMFPVAARSAQLTCCCFPWWWMVPQPAECLLWNSVLIVPFAVCFLIIKLRRKFSKAARIETCVTVVWNWSCGSLLQIIKEYERAIIFRLGRILKGGAKGPGMSWGAFWYLFYLSHWQNNGCLETLR